MSTRRFRLMTYNAHGCVGLDRKYSPERIAQVIHDLKPDVVALQELETWHPRGGQLDQPQRLAELLGWELAFQAARPSKTGRFGNAIFSRYPMKLVRGALLPTLPAPMVVRRGAIWVSLRTPWGEIQVINTHLGLLRAERFRQIESLFGRDWLVHPECSGPRIVCGDFNGVNEAHPSLLGTMRNVQHGRSKATWPSVLPFRRLDHVYACPSLEVAKVEIPRTKLTRVASDHLPLVVDFINRHAS